MRTYHKIWGLLCLGTLTLGASAAVVACSDDTTGPTAGSGGSGDGGSSAGTSGDGGSSGSGASGGSSGDGGSSGTGASGGSSGDAGSSGSGGMAGEGGSSGSGGMAGEGGSSGSAGSSGSSGSAGDAGASGSGASGGASGSGASGGSAGSGGSGGDTDVTATATITASTVIHNPAPNIAGGGTFTETNEMVTLTVNVTGCPAGMHGLHIHQGTDCGTDGSGALAHWDPLMAGVHGQVNDPTPHHAGDAGMINCDANGNGTFEITTDEWSITQDSEINPITHAVILHGLDASQRIACGVIETGGAGVAFTLAPTTLTVNPEATVGGTARFVARKDGRVRLDVHLTGCAEGQHGFHIHAGTECGEDGMLAMSHWDPLNAGVHGQVNDPAPHHAGDAGMVMCGADKMGMFSIMTDEWTLEPAQLTNPVGHAVILHGLDPANRVACGVIQAY